MNKNLVSRPEKHEELKSDPCYSPEFSMAEELVAPVASGSVGEFRAINQRIN